MTSFLVPTIATFDAKTALYHEKLAIAQLLQDCATFALPDDPPLNVEAEANTLDYIGPDQNKENFVVWDNPEHTAAQAYGMLAYDLKQNLNLAQAYIRVHPTKRRQGLGRQMAMVIKMAAQQQGRHTLASETSSVTEASEPFARSLGAEVILENRRSQLVLVEIDDERLKAWQVRPPNDPYILHVWHTIPDEYLQRSADMMMVMNTAPKGDIEMDDWVITPEMIRSWEQLTIKRRETQVFMMVEDTRSGEFVGYTELFWSSLPEQASLGYQGGTAVRPSARGLGLGKWLKAAMLDYARQSNPQLRFIRTSNADENAAMLGINIAMGFKPWAIVIEWKFILENPEK